MRAFSCARTHFEHFIWLRLAYNHLKEISLRNIYDNRPGRAPWAPNQCDRAGWGTAAELCANRRVLVKAEENCGSISSYALNRMLYAQEQFVCLYLAHRHPLGSARDSRFSHGESEAVANLFPNALHHIPTIKCNCWRSRHFFARSPPITDSFFLCFPLTSEEYRRQTNQFTTIHIRKLHDFQCSHGREIFIFVVSLSLFGNIVGVAGEFAVAEDKSIISIYA